MFFKTTVQLKALNKTTRDVGFVKTFLNMLMLTENM